MSDDEQLPPADFEAALTDDLKATLGEPDLFGYERRVMVTALTRSGPQLLEGFRDLKDEGGALLEAVDVVGHYRKHLETMLSLTQSAEARLIIVGQQLAVELEGEE